jgi:hypothetical protein
MTIASEIEELLLKLDAGPRAEPEPMVKAVVLLLRAQMLLLRAELERQALVQREAMALEAWIHRHLGRHPSSMDPRIQSHGFPLRQCLPLKLGAEEEQLGAEEENDGFDHGFGFGPCPGVEF